MRGSNICQGNQPDVQFIACSGKAFSFEAVKVLDVKVHHNNYLRSGVFSVGVGRGGGVIASNNLSCKQSHRKPNSS